MADPFVGEIRIVAFSFAPKNWATCDGQLMSLAQNTALFSILGTNFGGDGRSTFALPDFRGRVPVHRGQRENQAFALAQTGGEETHFLTVNELPAHTHPLNATTNPASSSNPQGNLAATSDPAVGDVYGPPTQLVAMEEAILFTGQGSPHQNMQPFLTLNFIIALQGVFPQRP